jgi:hypothetical protein
VAYVIANSQQHTSAYTYTYTHEDYVTHCVELYIYVEVRARNSKVFCMTVEVIPMHPSDFVVP